MNPPLYRADYFGEKMHIDQNEKLVMFGVTHIGAIDGYSGKIVAFSTMPIRNNITIYETIYRYFFFRFYTSHIIYICTCRKAISQYGLWDQLHFDHGKEWYLTILFNESLSHLRHDVRRPPHRQMSSTQVS